MKTAQLESPAIVGARGGRARGRRAGQERASARAAARARAQAASATGHTPVLANELLELLDPRPGQVAVDCTFGDGGHARLLAERLGAAGTLVAIDRDPAAQARCEALAEEVECTIRFIRAAYAEALESLEREQLRADIVYFDLGMSSMQIDTRERGFSYSYDAPLDMRMDTSQPFSVRELLAEWDERSIELALRDFGEERYARQIAAAIVARRDRAPLRSTLELVETISAAIPIPARFGGGHPAKRTFQALRIAVNDELGQLERALPAAWGLLRDGGVLAAICFHSLEDRRVKRFLGGLARGCTCPPGLPVCVCGRSAEAALLTRRAISASASELAHNPRAGSARLRAARKLAREEDG